MGQQDGEKEQFSSFPDGSSLSCAGTRVQGLLGGLNPAQRLQHSHRRTKACWDCHGLNCP